MNGLKPVAYTTRHDITLLKSHGFVIVYEQPQEFVLLHQPEMLPLYAIPSTHRVVSVDTLRALQSVIFEASDEVREWANYAPEMFQTKHNLKGSVETYRKVAESMSAIIDNEVDKGYGG